MVPITSIPPSAFNGCTTLVSIQLPQTLTQIKDSAFEGCSSLAGINIPKNVIKVGENAFKGCSSLAGVYITDASAWCRIEFESRANPLQFGTDANTLFLNGTELTEVVIPSDVTEIQAYAFCNCYSLKNITIPDSVTSIRFDAFSGCVSLKRVDITDLSAWCKIGFDDIQSHPLLYGAKLYLNGSELTDLTIPSDITKIKSFAFSDCTSLTSVTISDSVTSIGIAAFWGCTSLTSATIGNGVTWIGVQAFSGCSNLQAFYGKYASSDNCCLIVNGLLNSFANGCGATEYAIPDGVTMIGDNAFYECSSLTSVIIPDSVTSILPYAFGNCKSLKEVYCKPTTPPSEGYMLYNNAPGCKIYVPAASVDAYKTTDGWSKYADYIEGYDF